MAENTEQPWHAAYPTPRTQTPSTVTREEILGNIKRESSQPKSFLLIDVRRNDHEGGAIRGSLNLPAQSLYYSLPTLHQLCKRAGISDVIFYCGSSHGRGPRCAGWFADFLVDHGESSVQSIVLQGGIKGWANGGEEYARLMDGYDPGYWEQFKS